MADVNKSRGLDGRAEYLTERAENCDYKDEGKPFLHPSHIGVDRLSEGETVITDEGITAEGVTVKVDVDVSEALTGLKAVTREAKAATKALRELEAVQTDQTDQTACNDAFYQFEDVPASTVQRLMAHLDANGAGYYAGIQMATTKALSEELAKREGVTEYVVGLEDKATVQVYGVLGGSIREIEGPARLLVNKD